MAQLSQPLAGPQSPAPSRTAVKVRHLATNLVFYVIMAALAVVFLAPLLWMLTASLKPEYLVLATPPTFLPRHFQWENYQAVLKVIPLFAFNSFKLAFLTVGGVLIVTPLAAYAFARLTFWGRDFAFSILLATLMVPGIVTLIPLYIIYKNIGWIDTHYPLWVPKVLHSVTAIFLLRQFFRQIPMELEDAARLDGATTFQVYWKVMLPQVKPALAAVGIFSFLDSWNDLFGPLIYLNTLELQTLPVALKLFQGEFFTQISVLMAGASLSILPVLIVFFSAQKYFLQGITMTGIK
jgi:multiple sugar transport system permease protein/sn-glycerol 3-phosphate transport system permease protein